MILNSLTEISNSVHVSLPSTSNLAIIETKTGPDNASAML